MKKGNLYRRNKSGICLFLGEFQQMPERVGLMYSDELGYICRSMYELVKWWEEVGVDDSADFLRIGAAYVKADEPKFPAPAQIVIKDIVVMNDVKYVVTEDGLAILAFEMVNTYKEDRSETKKFNRIKH